MFITSLKYKMIWFAELQQQVVVNKWYSKRRFGNICFFLGKEGVIYNGIPDWLYSHTPELKSDTLAFSTDGSYLSFLSFDDSQVSKYEYV